MEEFEKTKLSRAIEIVDRLSEGIDPFSGEILDNDSIFNDVRIVRCFKYVEELLKNYDNKIKLTKKSSSHLLPFEITEEQKKNVIFESGIQGIASICKDINEKIDINIYKKLNAADVNKGLEKMGIIYSIEDGKRKNYYVEEEYKDDKGFVETISNFNGINVPRVLFDDKGKQFILDNVEKILECLEK